MIEDIILKQPEEIASKSRVGKNSVYIPANLRRKEIKGDLLEGLNSEVVTLEKALYDTVELPKQKLKQLPALLRSKGR